MEQSYFSKVLTWYAMTLTIDSTMQTILYRTSTTCLTVDTQPDFPKLSETRRRYKVTYSMVGSYTYGFAQTLHVIIGTHWEHLLTALSPLKKPWMRFKTKQATIDH
jgi:hypothetical protein